MKSYAFSKKYEVNLRNINAMKRKERIGRNSSQYSTMSMKTKDFIQKICYRKTASIDMTQYGFINDSTIHPVNLMVKPLRAQLEKICGKPPRKTPTRRNLPTSKNVSLQSTVSNNPHQVVGSSRGSPIVLNSALCSPESDTPRRPTRRVTIITPSNPTTHKKRKAKVVSPGVKPKKK